jgi:transcriptional/translational regulatory protein YebC/TACO1
LEEIENIDGSIYIYGDYTNFGSLSIALENLGIEVNKATLKRLPLNQVEFNEEQLTDIEKLIDRIEDDDDVQAVYTNIA